MMSFQVSFADIPKSPQMDVFFVIVPLVGLPLLLIFGANIFNILRIFFVRGEREQTWQKALAATIESPIVVCGVGRVGYRIANQILDLGRPAVGIEAVSSPLVDALIERNMPVIMGDIRSEDVLRHAGVERARTVLVCTHNDLANIEAAFRARELNPHAEIVLRLFEDEIADEIKQSFDVKTIISRSAIAAQAFAHAALGMEVLETFDLGEHTYFLAKIPLGAGNPLIDQSVHTISEDQDVTIVCLYREGHFTPEPDPDTRLQCDDALFIFADVRRLSALVEVKARPQAQIVVCGLGHAGYRVVKALLALNRQVIALDLEPSRLSERLRGQGIAVVYGDFRQRVVLEEAGIRQATAIITCTDNDMVNFEAVLRARELNPAIRVVVRIFEEALGERLQRAFHLHAVYSTSAIAAPAFVSAALNIHTTQPIDVGEEKLVIARLVIETLSGLYHEKASALTQQDDLTVLLHKTKSGVQIPPAPDATLAPDDEIVVLASSEKLRELSQRNRATRDIAP